MPLGRDGFQQPLVMTSAINLDDRRWARQTPPVTRGFALGPPRPARAEGRGWLYAAGELAMTAHDLAVWDISLIEHKLLKPASLDVMTTPVRLRNGTPTNYPGVGVLDARRTSQAGSWRRSVRIRELEHRLAESRRGCSGVRQFGRLRCARVDYRSGRVTPVDGGGRFAGGAGFATSAAIFDGLLEGKIDRDLLTSNADATSPVRFSRTPRQP